MLTIPLFPKFKIPFDLIFPALIYLFWRFGTPRIGLSHAETRGRTLWRLILLPIVGLIVVAVQIPTAANDWRGALCFAFGPFHSAGLDRSFLQDIGAGSRLLWPAALFMLIRTMGMVYALAMGAAEHLAALRRIRAMPRTPIEEGVELIHSQGWLAFSFGLVRPRIYVSEGVYYSRHRAAVLAHEREHVRRRDPLRRAVAHAVRRLLWYMPFWRDLTESFDLAIECSCDSRASREVGKAAYARALLAFTLQLRPQLGTATAQFNDGVSSLLSRARALAGDDEGATPRLFWPLFTLIYILLIVLS
jgi:Zn-dependent protease with chaperone function